MTELVLPALLVGSGRVAGCPVPRPARLPPSHWHARPCSAQDAARLSPTGRRWCPTCWSARSVSYVSHLVAHGACPSRGLPLQRPWGRTVAPALPHPDPPTRPARGHLTCAIASTSAASPRPSQLPSSCNSIRNADFPSTIPSAPGSTFRGVIGSRFACCWAIRAASPTSPMTPGTARSRSRQTSSPSRRASHPFSRQERVGPTAIRTTRCSVWSPSR